VTDDGDRRDSAGDAFRDGVRTVTGVLGALVETLEQTFSDLRDGSDLSPERARETARSTVRKAQETVEDFRDRFDFVTRREFEALRDDVARLRAQLDLADPPAQDAEPAPEAPGPNGDTGSTADDEGFPIDEG
jgi:hypothetical protein